MAVITSALTGEPRAKYGIPAHDLGARVAVASAPNTWSLKGSQLQLAKSCKTRDKRIRHCKKTMTFKQFRHYWGEVLIFLACGGSCAACAKLLGKSVLTKVTP